MRVRSRNLLPREIGAGYVMSLRASTLPLRFPEENPYETCFAEVISRLDMKVKPGLGQQGSTGKPPL